MENSENQQSKKAFLQTPSTLLIPTCNKTKQQKRAKLKLRKCRVCRKSFRNLDLFKAHIGFHKKNPTLNLSSSATRKFQCRICNTLHDGLFLFHEHQQLHQQNNTQPGNFLAVSSIPNQNNVPSTPMTTTTDRREVLIQTSDGEFQLATLSPLQSHQFKVAEDVNTASNVTQSNTATPFDSTNSAISSDPLTNLYSSHNQQQRKINNEINLNVPANVKTIHLNSDTSMLSNITRQIDILNRKVDFLIKHLNLPVIETLEENNVEVPIASSTIEVSQKQHEASITEGYPPSYSIIQAAKEQQQQEYYALQLSSRQIMKNDEEAKHKKGQQIDGLWSQQYLVAQEHTREDSIPQHLIDKVFVESRSRANFAKNLTFSIFSAEERARKNCTGRVYGKAQLKGQLDQEKLQLVKEATFRKYPCQVNLLEMTWRKECITAIDSGLRNEHRSNISTPSMLVTSKLVQN